MVLSSITGSINVIQLVLRYCFQCNCPISFERKEKSGYSHTYSSRIVDTDTAGSVEHTKIAKKVLTSPVKSGALMLEVNEKLTVNGTGKFSVMILANWLTSSLSIVK